MSMGGDDITTMAVRDLLDGVDDAADSVDTQLTAWTTSVGIFPGSLRVPAAKLIQSYHDWCRSNSREPLADVTAWGKWMKERYQFGRGKIRYYYISWDREVKLTAAMIEKLRQL